MNAIPSPFATIEKIIGEMRRFVGDWGLPQALAWLFLGRIGRILTRIDGLVKRFQAGTLRVCGPRKASAPRVAAAREGRAAAKIAGKVCLPNSFGWLIKLCGYQAVGRASQIQAALAQPEMVAFLKASPQVARALRPLCHMLMIDVSLLYPGVEMPEKPAKVAMERPKRVRKPRPKQDLGRVPIPRGVMSAVRRGRYGKIG